MEENVKNNLNTKKDAEADIQQLVKKAANIQGFKAAMYTGIVVEILEVIMLLIPLMLILANIKHWTINWLFVCLFEPIVPLLIFLIGQKKFINDVDSNKYLSVSILSTMTIGIRAKLIFTYYYALITTIFLFRLYNYFTLKTRIKDSIIILFWGITVLLMIGYIKAEKNIASIDTMQMTNKICEKNLSILSPILNIIKCGIETVAILYLILKIHSFENSINDIVVISRASTYFEWTMNIIYVIVFIYLLIVILHMMIHIFLGLATIRYNRLLDEARAYNGQN